MYTDKSFERAYLQSLHLIKEDVDDIENQEVKPEENKVEAENKPTGKCICFCTTDQNLIDAINSGFEKVVFTVKTADDDVTDVEFDAAAFGEIEVKDQEAEEECPECGKSPCECEKEEDLDLNEEVEEEIEEDAEEDVDEEPVEECGDNQITEEDDEEDLGEIEESEESEEEDLTEEDIIKECRKLRQNRF